MPPARRRYVQAPEIFSSFSSKTVDEGTSGTVYRKLKFLSSTLYRIAKLTFVICHIHQEIGSLKEKKSAAVQKLKKVTIKLYFITCDTPKQAVIILKKSIQFNYF
jgi:hypothetical protein